MPGEQPQQFVHQVPKQLGPMGMPVQMGFEGSPVKVEHSPSKSIFLNPIADKKSMLNIDAKPFKIGGPQPQNFQQQPAEIDP